MTGTVRLTIKKTTKKDKGKYTAKIFRCEKEVTETTLNVVGEYCCASLALGPRVKLFDLVQLG